MKSRQISIQAELVARAKIVAAQLAKDGKRLNLHSVNPGGVPPRYTPTVSQVVRYALELYLDQLAPVETTPKERLFAYQDHCPKCNHNLKFKDSTADLPLLGRNCRGCGNPLVIREKNPYCQFCEQYFPQNPNDILTKRERKNRDRMKGITDTAYIRRQISKKPK